MIKLDDNLLNELGLGGLPKEEKAEFLKHMYQTLELNVGTQLANRMSDAQMSEFEQYINGNDEQGAFHWLEANFPDYKDVVAAEFDKLKIEIKPVADQIVAASASQTAAPAIPEGNVPPAQDYQPQYAAPQQQPPAYPQQPSYGPPQPGPAQPPQQPPQYGPGPQHSQPPQPPAPQY